MPYGHRLTKMNEQFSTEELWLLVRHYERLIQLLLEQLEKASDHAAN